jgi:hypothetical protein
LESIARIADQSSFLPGNWTVLDASIELTAKIGQTCASSTLPFVGVDMLSRIARVRLMQTNILADVRDSATPDCTAVLGQPSREQRCLVFLDHILLNAPPSEVLRKLTEIASGHQVVAIVTGKADACFPHMMVRPQPGESHADGLRLLNAPFVVRWLAVNPCQGSYANVESLPVGLKWAHIPAPMGHDDIELAKSVHNPQFRGLKDRLIRRWKEAREGRLQHKLVLNAYVPFTTSNPRLYQYAGLRSRLMAAVQSRFGERARSTVVPFVSLYNVTRQYQMVMAPPGNGPDTHRFWESIVAGSIPVVASDTPLNSLYRAMPHIKLDRMEDVTPESLEAEFRRFGRLSHPDRWNLHQLYHIWHFARAHCLARTPEVLSLGLCIDDLEP